MRRPQILFEENKYKNLVT